MPLLPTAISFSDYISLNVALFERLIWEATPVENHMTMALSPRALGGTLLKPQHFIGASNWIKRGEFGWDEVFASGLRKFNIGLSAVTEEPMMIVNVEDVEIERSV
ncbi:MAG: hypothetical protein Q9208_001190 [Pyrenodesmia sp. 3 TL-2023]